MTHALWTTHEWETATEEQIIQALFQSPEFPDPRDMEKIKRLNPTAIRKYQTLFYGGEVPGYAANPYKPGVLQRLGHAPLHT
jgi:hypothetical protein